MISLTTRRWLISLHLLFSAILFGVTIAYLVFSINALTSRDQGELLSDYQSMHLLSVTSGRFSIIGTLVTGIVLSVLTHWGLFRYYWIILKEILSLFSLVIVFGFIPQWSLDAIIFAKSGGIHSATLVIHQQQLLVSIILQIISLTTMILLSVFKPRKKAKKKNES
ncbi:hypothetical protein SAMN05444392_1102 [Seinonella peptonophila]|uniref:Uncharacterized protein n=1 Tax=Seinonella peptonophila TaxID=112248 RepID=A0A1M4ZMM3_9BACL|nr:hypothetical protein [Seinonella peptonophila]SHF19175.1 hypothetical protein SAMN05444392_1102 [Seinonella peptonophila]